MKAWRPGHARQAIGWMAVALACAGYAVLAYRAAAAPRPGLFEACVFILPLMAFALPVAWRSSRRGLAISLWLALAGGLFLARDQLAAGTQWVLLAQHVGINMGLCLAFGRTLVPGAKPLVSRMAEIVQGALSPRLVRYTRAVTWAWTLFFALTSLASIALFVFAPATLWSAFVNLLALPLLVAMFAGEYLVRITLIPRVERAGFLQAVGAYRQLSAGKTPAE